MIPQENDDTVKHHRRPHNPVATPTNMGTVIGDNSAPAGTLSTRGECGQLQCRQSKEAAVQITRKVTAYRLNQ